jgi:hypothetical protein
MDFAACTSTPSTPSPGPDLPLPNRAPDSTQTPEGGSSGSPDAGDTRRDDSGTTGVTDAGFEATTTPPAFTDLFNRADNADVGNGWVEKSDNFSISANSVLQTGTGSYLNLLVWRPADAASLNVEVSMDFTYGAGADTDPALYARLQPTSSQVGTMSGYSFYSYPDQIGIDREDGTLATPMAKDTIAPALVEGQTYHFVFRVTGTNPVHLQGALSQGATTLKTLAFDDTAAGRIMVKGVTGFGSGKGDGSRFDNFKRVDLP